VTEQWGKIDLSPDAVAARKAKQREEILIACCRLRFEADLRVKIADALEPALLETVNKTLGFPPDFDAWGFVRDVRDTLEADFNASNDALAKFRELSETAPPQ